MRKLTSVLLSLAFGTVVLAGCSQPPPPDDKAIALAAQTLYINDADLFKVANITISSENGVIVLTGEVPEQKFKDRAEKLMQSVKGTRGIKNEIDVHYVFTEKP